LARLFEQKPEHLPIAVSPTRQFCLTLFVSKIEVTIKNEGDMIGWESDNNVVGPAAAAAKQSLLKLVPLIMPMETTDSDLYHLVLDHGDFGIHNMSITLDADKGPAITSLHFPVRLGNWLHRASDSVGPVDGSHGGPCC
jgi:hypothetical protein